MASAPCQNHLDVPAVGICMRCQAALCSECITKVDGVNHCQRCLLTLARSVPRLEQSHWLPTWLSLALAGLCLWLLLWSTLEALFPRGPAL